MKKKHIQPEDVAVTIRNLGHDCSPWMLSAWTGLPEETVVKLRSLLYVIDGAVRQLYPKESSRQHLRRIYRSTVAMLCAEGGQK